MKFAMLRKSGTLSNIAHSVIEYVIVIVDNYFIISYLAF
jgi:hypothetical protein